MHRRSGHRIGIESAHRFADVGCGWIHGVEGEEFRAELLGHSRCIVLRTDRGCQAEGVVVIAYYAENAGVVVDVADYEVHRVCRPAHIRVTDAHRDDLAVHHRRGGRIFRGEIVDLLC